MVLQLSKLSTTKTWPHIQSLNQKPSNTQARSSSHKVESSDHTALRNSINKPTNVAIPLVPEVAGAVAVVDVDTATGTEVVATRPDKQHQQVSSVDTEFHS